MNVFRRDMVISFLFLGAFVLLAAETGHAEEPNCSVCHETLATGKSVHTAVSMGCSSCHTGVDASDLPHKLTNRNPKGLSVKMRDICYSCHDKKPFMKSTVHGALLLGCTRCHSPHVSDHAHLLKEEVPGLCLACHGELLAAKNGSSHVLTGNEACSNCHNPHSTDTPKLVLTNPKGATSGQTALAAKPEAVKQQ